MTAKGSKNPPYIIAWVDSLTLRLSRSFPVDVYVVTQRVEVIATRRVLFLYECKSRTRLAGGYSRLQQNWRDAPPPRVRSQISDL